ncbi:MULTISPECIES: DUF2690 domain-containing protein [Bacillus cereus group]|uniref:DUF2690 domain-containing protein n=1 Tax=Bacillus wiedmannii TaxID=1890302 RepID=A0A2B6M3Z7_9BACI|nr:MULTISPECIES: DUF2690 domain-containing protein [Bacillus cereus group]KAA0790610.1 DUF2690 domain-containing protein [Bacillus sp. BB081]KKZ99058.1 hypothetical protein B4147_3642 [Bacillus wiedmannii]PEA75299.1 DUF2690 domain-containing protein [Bacillus wiedmannii]PEG07795.1 DUF2690 domain-containing protein [Bacillus wiedmannii]PEI79923.1 DUF2690 domain-containing protein [Bacillus wiedmannii]
MFKKLMKVCVLSAASVGVLFSFQGSTFAATDLSSYYDGKNPATTKVYGGSTTCDADGFNAKSTAVYEGSKKVGTVYLRYSNKCHAAWSKFVLDQPAPSVSGGIYAYAVINKYKNGVFQKSVDSNNGNGAIKTGQTSTYTGMVFDLTADFGYTADAEAVTTNNGYGKTGRY